MALVANMKKIEKGSLVVLEQTFQLSLTQSIVTVSFDLSSYDLTGKTASDFLTAFKIITDTNTGSSNVWQTEDKTLSGTTLTCRVTGSGGGQTSSGTVYCVFVE